MSLRPDFMRSAPEGTARVAQAVFRKGHLCVRLRDALGTISGDALFADLLPAMGRPAEAPWR
jgi:transposase